MQPWGGGLTARVPCVANWRSEMMPTLYVIYFIKVNEHDNNWAKDGRVQPGGLTTRACVANWRSERNGL